MPGHSRQPIGLTIIPAIEISKGMLGLFFILSVFPDEKNLSLLVIITTGCIVKVTVGINLLRRKEWARKTFLALLFIAAVFIFLNQIFLWLWMNTASLIVLSSLVILFLLYYVQPGIRTYFK